MLISLFIDEDTEVQRDVQELAPLLVAVMLPPNWEVRI